MTNPIDSFLVNGKPKLLQTFVVPEMSLNSNRATMAPHAFALCVNAARIGDLLARPYAELVAELRADDAICGGPQDALAIAGYPKLSEVLKEPELALLVLGCYLIDDWLTPFTGDGDAVFKYWFDEFKHCEIVGDSLTLAGVCFS